MVLQRRTRALTLLELLLVIFLLSALAASAITLASDADTESRLELTRARRAQIETAIVGEDERVDGERLIGGFVADMGRLPTSIQELLEPPLDGQATPQPLLYARDTSYQASAGWRGPYLSPAWERGVGSSTRVFRDGWSTRRAAAPAPDPNFGWILETDPDAGHDPPAFLDVISLGRDGISGGTGPDADFPYPPGSLSSPADDHRRLVAPDAWSDDRVDGAPRALTVVVCNHPDSAAALDVAQLRARVVVPRVTAGASIDWSVGTSWTSNRDDRGDVSSLGTPSASLGAGASATVTFTFQPVSAGDRPYARLPAGRWPLVLAREADGSRAGPVSPAPGMSGSSLALWVTVPPRGTWALPQSTTEVWVYVP